MNNQPKTISVELTDSQAYALAQFFKRLTFQEFQKMAVDRMDADEMQQAAILVRSALAKAGYDPR